MLSAKVEVLVVAVLIITKITTNGHFKKFTVCQELF